MIRRIAIFAPLFFSLCSCQDKARGAANSIECDPGSSRRVSVRGWTDVYARCSVPDGPWVEWGESGRAVTGTFRRGMRDGRWTYYGKNGEVVKEETYHDGALVTVIP